MSHNIEHEFQGPILTLKFGADYTMTEMLETLESCVGRYATSQPIGILYDASRSKGVRRIDEIRTILPRIAKLKDKIAGLAVLVASDFHFGLSNQSSAYAEIEGIDLQPFRDLEEARAWLLEMLCAA